MIQLMEEINRMILEEEGNQIQLVIFMYKQELSSINLGLKLYLQKVLKYQLQMIKVQMIKNQKLILQKLWRKEKMIFQLGKFNQERLSNRLMEVFIQLLAGLLLISIKLKFRAPNIRITHKTNKQIQPRPLRA